MSKVLGPPVGVLLAAVREELEARTDLAQPPAQPSGKAVAFRVWIDEDGTTDVTAEGAENRPDAFNSAAIRVGDGDWSLPKDAHDQAVMWARSLEIEVVVWAADETAALRRLCAVVSAFHRRIAGAYRPVRDQPLRARGAQFRGVQRRLILRVEQAILFDESPAPPFDGVASVKVNSAGVDNEPGASGDGALDAFEES